VKTLKTTFPQGEKDGRRLLVFAGSGDKDLPGMFATLAPHFAHVFLTRYGNSPRGVPPEQLGEILRGTADLPFTVYFGCLFLGVCRWLTYISYAGIFPISTVFLPGKRRTGVPGRAARLGWWLIGVGHTHV